MLDLIQRLRAVALVALMTALIPTVLPSWSAADAVALDDSSKDEDKAKDKDKAEKEPPKEKKPVTVPVGTSIMVRTGEKVSSDDKAGRRFSATLQANLQSGETVVAQSGSQVFGQVVSSKQVGRGIVVSHSDLKLTLSDINIDGTMYPIVTGSFSEQTNAAILKRRSVVIPAGSILEFKLEQPLTVKK